MTVTVSTNGSLQNQVNFQLDGGTNMDNYTNVNMPFPFSGRASGIQRANQQLQRTVRGERRRYG